MDLVIAGCQGIGLALACGLLAGGFAGALGSTGAVRMALIALGALGAALLFGASLTPEDHPAWPGWPIGAVAAVLTALVAEDVIGAARERDEGVSAAGLFAFAAFAAAAVALVSLLFGPLSVPVLVALAWLGLSRRRAAGRKYAGLRVLR